MFGWRRSTPAESDARVGSAGDAPGTPAPEPQNCPSLAKVLARTFKGERPAILDLGPLCGEGVVRLASRGARVTVERFRPPEAPPARKPGDPPWEPPPFRLDQPDEAFDLVLVWEHLDFTPPERLGEVATELRRILRPGGALLAFCLARSDEPAQRIPRYRVLDDDRLVREIEDGPRLRRFVHPNREIERGLAGLAIQGIHLQRNQMREFVAIRS